MPNQLINEQSLYLQQHAHNPVDWHPWGEDVFETAKRENKPVIVSIGYAACHWCHVMERESFEDAETAAYMNAHFINVKVDREEHPDVDHVYMDAVQAISGSGGWPLNVFVTSDKIPFYGGTYFPPRPAYNRPSWMQLLQRIHELWTQRPDEIEHQSQQMIAFLKNASDIRIKTAHDGWDNAACEEMAASLLKHADKKEGGFGNAPKFPQTMAINYLLEYAHYTGNEEAKQQALLSLDKMMEGGIYDQLGGGFARYSTDAQWLAPHFEKMLYDNALLIDVYSTAYKLTKCKRYKQVITETIEFAERELKDESGIYYSALDADSEGEEGKFYTWTWEEWKAVFHKEDDELIRQYFGIEQEGNWEHTNILHIAKSIETIAEETGIPEKIIEEKINTAKQKLWAARSKRIRPLTDDKSLLSWNALMNIALIKAYNSLGEKSYLQKAEKHMNLLLEKFETAGVLHHVWKAGKARIAPNLEDYSFLIRALLQLAGASGNTEFIVKANEYCERVADEFLQEDGVLFYYTSKHSANVPVRKIDLYDGALPSANAVMCDNLFLLGGIMSRTDWTEQAYIMLQQVTTAVTKHTLSFSYWAMLLQRYVKGFKTIVVAGKNAHSDYEELMQQILSHSMIWFIHQEENNIPLFEYKYLSDETYIFVCTQEVCYAPVMNVSDTLKLV